MRECHTKLHLVQLTSENVVLFVSVNVKVPMPESSSGPCWNFMSAHKMTNYASHTERKGCMPKTMNMKKACVHTHSCLRWFVILEGRNIYCKISENMTILPFAKGAFLLKVHAPTYLYAEQMKAGTIFCL